MLNRKLYYKIYIFIVLITCLINFFPTPAYANSVSMSLYPSSGYAILGQDFKVDIMLDTKGLQTTKAKAVLKFDPEFVKVTKAEHGDLYCQYLDDEYTVDNQEGWIVLTGFCLDPYYSTASQPELFGRFTFRPQKEGETEIKFIINDTPEDKTLAKDTGSPPQDATVVTKDGKYNIVSNVTPPPQPSNGGGKLPGVGILDNQWIWIGIGLILTGGFIFVIGGIVFRLIKSISQGDKRIVIAN